MDIVAALATQLKLEQEFASGLAGGLLLLIEDLVRDRADFATSSSIRAAIPEMRDWQMSSPTLAPGTLNVDTIPPPQVTGDEGEVIAVIGRFGVDPAAAGQVTALMYEFLTSRLSPEKLSLVTKAMPALTGRRAA